MPPLVVAMAGKPAAANSCALPTSQAFGITKPGVARWSAANVAARESEEGVFVMAPRLGPGGPCVQSIVSIIPMRFVHTGRRGLRVAPHLPRHPPGRRLHARDARAAPLSAGDQPAHGAPRAPDRRA